MTRNIGDMCQEIIARRNCGRVTCAVIERESASSGRTPGVPQLLDEFVARFGFKGIGDAWNEITVADARTVVHAILRADLAYHANIMPEVTAAELATQFLCLFCSTAQCFTNGTLVLPPSRPNDLPNSWDPISAATLDTGVVCFDDDRIGILWVEDED